MDNIKEIHLTPEGRQKLVDELEWREGEKNNEIVERIQEARGFGDRAHVDFHLVVQEVLEVAEVEQRVVLRLVHVVVWLLDCRIAGVQRVACGQPGMRR